MRSILILLVTVAIMVGGFLVYIALQSKSAPPPPQRTVALPEHVPPVERPADSPIVGEGEDVWVKSYDPRTGELSFQFRAARYDPQPDGSVRVEKPQAELFVGRDRRQVVRLEGVGGRVIMAGDVTQRGQIRTSHSVAPQRGELHDVTISLFDEANLKTPILVCRVNNIAFDNDTFRIATEGYDDAAGRHVPADQVRVEVRGEDFDFDGRGLTIRWNEADRRLQMLEVAHGESLVIKAPQVLRALAGERREGPAAKREAEEPVRLASASDVPAAVPADNGAERRQPPVYRATFHDTVRVTQAEHAIAAADQLLVDFLGSREEAIAPRPAPPDEPAAREAPRDQPVQLAPRPQPSDPQPPLVVRWFGKLRVTAMEADAPRPAPGSVNIAMHSEHGPVTLDHRGLKVICAAFDYRSGDDSLSVTSSPSVPMILLETADGARVRTPSIVYDGVESKATLAGPSRATFRLAADAESPDEPATLVTEWNDSCVLSLIRTADNEMSVERAVLTGSAAVEHPQFILNADALDLALQRVAGNAHPVPRELTADGSVHGRLLSDDPDAADREIRSDRLRVAMEKRDDGELFPRTIVADGNVVALADGSQLQAGHLTVMLLPARADKPAGAADGPFAGGDFELESLRALQHVSLTTPEGQSAIADQLDVKSTPEGLVADLLGQPEAVLSDFDNTLIGPLIKLSYASQQLSVHGPGSLNSLARQSPDEPPRPVKIAWKSSLAADGLANSAEIAGDVTIESTAPDGSQQVASAKRVRIAFADAPAETALAAAVDEPRERPDAFSAVSGKSLRTITLDGDSEVRSLLAGDDPSHVRRMHIFAPLMRYDLEDQTAEVPSAGRMLLQDTRPAPTQQQQQHAADDATADNRLFSGFRGATAFQWNDSLTFDQNGNRITMAGAVLIVHQDGSSAEPSFRMEASQVAADLLSSDESPTTRPADAVGLFGPSELRLKQLTADGDIRIRSPQLQLDAQHVTYDAISELLTARGDERTPVELFTEQGLSRGSFQEVIFNARTEQIERMREVRAAVRR